MSAPDLRDYVDVAERVAAFYARFPEGRLTTAPCPAHSTADRVCMVGMAYRDPDDLFPATGHSWLGIPGSTPYTRGSEVENAETSAVGRAIAFTGIPTKRIASADEVRTKSTAAQSAPSSPAPAAVPVPPSAETSPSAEAGAPRWTRSSVGLAAKKAGLSPAVLIEKKAERGGDPATWTPDDWHAYAIDLGLEDVK